MAKRIRNRIRRYRSRPRRRRSGRGAIPILPLIGVGAQFMSNPNTMPNLMAGNWNNVVDDLKWTYLGLHHDNKFNLNQLITSYIPVMAGIAASAACTKFGINRQIKRVPLLGKWVKL